MNRNVPRSRGRTLRWLLASATVVLCSVYVLNVPFYAGASLGTNGSWRMEHGRLTVERGTPFAPESFYIAVNSEGLRFKPEAQRWSSSSWRIVVPLWLPIALTSGLLGLSMVRERRRAKQRVGLCKRCGYDIRGLTRCPECGTSAERA